MATQSIREGFQPNIPDQPEYNFLRYSQGIDVPRGFGRSSMATLFEGVADAINVGVTGIDQAFQSTIRNEATEAVDQVRDEFAVDDATATQAPAGQGPNPEGLKRAYREVEGLTAAVQSGRLKESHYWARLDSVARQLRQKYPGYREHIDSTISRLTGGTPANQLRAALFDEARAAANDGDSAEKAYRKLEERANFQGYLGSDYWSMKPGANGARMSYDGLSQLIAKKAEVEHVLKSRQQEAAVESAENKLAGDKRDSLYATEANRVVSNAMGALTQGKNYKELMLDINKMAEAQARGEQPSLQDRQQLIAQFGQLELNVKTALANHFNDKGPEGRNKSYAEMYGADTGFKAIQEAALGRVTATKQALIDGDFGFLKSEALHMQAAKDMAISDMYQKYPQLRQFQAVRSEFGETAAALAFQENPELLTAISQLQLNGERLNLFTKGTSLKSGVDNAVRDGNANSKWSMAYVRSALAGILNNNLPDDQLINVINGVFGPQNQGFLARFNDQEVLKDPRGGPETILYKKHELLSLMASPQIAKRIHNLATDKGLPNVWENYVNWVNDSASALYFRDLNEFKNLQNNKHFQEGSRGIRFNPESFKFEMYQKKAAPLPAHDAGAIGSMREAQIMAAERITFRLNHALGPVLNAVRLEGGNGLERLNEILEANGIRFEALPGDGVRGGFRGQNIVPPREPSIQNPEMQPPIVSP